MGRLNVRFPQGKPGGFTAYCGRPGGQHIESVRLSSSQFCRQDTWDISTVKLWNPLNPEHPTFADEFRGDAESDDPIQSRKGEMMVDLVRHLETNVAGPRVCATRSCDELCLVSAVRAQRSTSIRIWIDANDYAPLENEMPSFHYRVNYSVPNDTSPHPLSVDRRSQDVNEVSDFVLEAIDRCR